MFSAKDLLTSSQRADHEQATMQRVLLMQAKQKKRQAADLAAGRLVRITVYPPGTPPAAGLYPTRVAAFACKVLGQQLPNTRGIRFDITTQGSLHSAYYPTKQAELAMQALMANAQADKKRIDRRFHNELARATRLAAGLPQMAGHY